MKKLICFDLDGTLLDTNRLHFVTFNMAFKKNGLRKVRYKEISHLFGLVKREIVKTLFSELSENKLKKILKNKNKFTLEDSHKFVKNFPGVKKSLIVLKKKYDLGIVSNCSHKEIVTLLKNADIDLKLFSVIVGDDDVIRGKPYPDEIFKAKKISGLNVEYMVGDTIYDVKAGKKAKIKTIGVLTGVHDKKILEKEKPWKIIRSVRDLPKYI